MQAQTNIVKICLNRNIALKNSSDEEVLYEGNTNERTRRGALRHGS